MSYDVASFRLFVIISLIVFSFNSYAQDPAELPPITVVAPASDGGNILCQGEGCAGVLSALADSGYTLPYTDHTGLADSGDDYEADRPKFCKELKEQKPDNCTAYMITGVYPPVYAYPSVPGFDADWSPNGCGTGPIANAFAGSALDYLMDDYHTLDEPYEGASFLDACNTHDLCFGTGGSSFVGCNNDFKSDMYEACGSENRCEVYADGYYFAVSTDAFGRSAYDNAQAAHQCAAWARQMELNKCAL